MHTATGNIGKKTKASPWPFDISWKNKGQKDEQPKSPASDESLSKGATRPRGRKKCYVLGSLRKEDHDLKKKKRKS